MRDFCNDFDLETHIGNSEGNDMFVVGIIESNSGSVAVISKSVDKTCQSQQGGECVNRRNLNRNISFLQLFLYHSL